MEEGKKTQWRLRKDKHDSHCKDVGFVSDLQPEMYFGRHVCVRSSHLHECVISLPVIVAEEEKVNWRR